MKSFQNTAAKWLNDFLSARGLEGATGQHLFKYHATVEEFRSLGDTLRGFVVQAREMGYHNPFSMGLSKAEAAAFVLYATLYWQREFSGMRWKWGDIWESLGIAKACHDDTVEVVKKGLAWWQLAPNVHGHKYIGAIAREAGLPQKLLSEGHGKIGDILTRVLGRSVAHHNPYPYLEGWVAEQAESLPASYLGSRDTIVQSLVNSIQVILDIKSSLTARSSKEAQLELAQKRPDWRREFPFPLDEANSCKLLERLLEEAVREVHGRPVGSLIYARRELRKITDGLWELCAAIELPDKMRVPQEGMAARKIGLHIETSYSSYGPVFLRRCSEEDTPLYFAQNRQDFRFKGEEAASDIVLRRSTVSGVLSSELCAGGTGLDSELPWIFEGEEFGYAFCQQGGGNVQGKEALVALQEGWSVDGGERFGILEAFGRTLWRLCSSSVLRGEAREFVVSLNGKATNETLDWNQNGALTSLEMIWPKRAFYGQPEALLRSEGGRERVCAGRMRWKSVSGGEYRPFAGSVVSGPVQIWFSGESGACLRSTVLMLKESARFSVKPGKDGGTILFKDWGFSAVSLATGQPEVDMVCLPQPDQGSFTVELSLKEGACPVQSVELLLQWNECSRDARIRVPFPAKGVRLFDGGGRYIKTKGRISIFALQGMKLHYFGLDPRAMRISLSLVHDKRKYLDYPIKTERDFGEIWMLDWQKRLCEMLALDSSLDALVRLECNYNGVRLAYWDFSRYGERLERGDGEVFLPNVGDAAGRDIVAVLLTRPDMGSVRLPLKKESSEKQSWTLAPLTMKGPWLIYDAAERASMRPLLHVVDDGEDAGELNKLQRAIAGPDPELRSEAFKECINAMLEKPAAPEWNTLFQLFKHLKHLPLSTLEVWQELIRNPRAMAVLALHDELDFVGMTSRVIAELPFLWNFISFEDWKFAASFIRSSFKERYAQLGSKGEMLISRIWAELMESRIDCLTSYSPSINSILNVAIDLPSGTHVETRERAANMKLALLKLILFEEEESELQKLLRSYAENTNWPDHFSKIVRKFGQHPGIKEFLPFVAGNERRDSQWQFSIVGLPILLALQNFSSKPLCQELVPSQDLVFHILRHIRFAPEWFEEASKMTAYCCYAEKFHYPCEVE